MFSRHISGVEFTHIRFSRTVYKRFIFKKVYTGFSPPPRAQIVNNVNTYPGRNSVPGEHAILGQHTADAHRYRIHAKRLFDSRFRVHGSFQHSVRDRRILVRQKVSRFFVHCRLRARVRRQMIESETTRIRHLEYKIIINNNCYRVYKRCYVCFPFCFFFRFFHCALRITRVWEVGKSRSNIGIGIAPRRGISKFQKKYHINANAGVKNSSAVKSTRKHFWKFWENIKEISRVKFRTNFPFWNIWKTFQINYQLYTDTIRYLERVFTSTEHSF